MPILEAALSWNGLEAKCRIARHRMRCSRNTTFTFTPPFSAVLRPAQNRRKMQIYREDRQNEFRWGYTSGTEHLLLLCPSTIFALHVQLVFLVSAFAMVNTVWPVSCLLLFYSRWPRTQPFVTGRGGGARVGPPCPMESAPVTVLAAIRTQTFRYFPQDKRSLPPAKILIEPQKTADWTTYRLAKKRYNLFSTPSLRQILTDFQTYFTVKITITFVIIMSLKIPPHLKCVAILLCEISVS